MKRRKVIYPGTFDPVTFGHIDIIIRASKIFDQVVIAVARNPDKGTLFTIDERLSMVRRAVKGMKNVEVDDFDGLVVDYARKIGANVMVRGLRMISDFEYEFQMALTNRKLNKEIETVFMMPHESYSYISSKLIKEAARLDADVSSFVPKRVSKLLKRRLKGA